MKWMTLIRIIFVCILIYGVCTGSGVWKALTFLLIAIDFEIIRFFIKKYVLN